MPSASESIRSLPDISSHEFVIDFKSEIRRSGSSTSEHSDRLQSFQSSTLGPVLKR